jgi:hypothetical protein
MTVDLRAWQLVAQADGIALLPPAGISDGVVRIRDLQRPLRSAADIFARANTTPELATGAIESLITSEGEYAAFSVQSGTIAGSEVVRFVGAVFGDDAYTLIVALASASNAARVEPVARMCVKRCSLGLGHRRQRRYHHAAPPGWTQHAWGLASRWRSPDGAELVVHPAIPSTIPIEKLLGAIAERHRAGTLDEVAAPTSACLGRAWRAPDLDIVILDDGRFRYVLELSGGHRDVLARVVGSVRLVPPAESTPITAAMLHWAD